MKQFETLFLALIFLVFVSTSCKVLYVSYVFRHGARYPINNMYDGKQMALTHGNLTSVGLREHFLLGSYMQSDYISHNQTHLLNKTLNPRQLEIFTLTDQTRCIQSAYAHALGLFSFSFGSTIDPNIDPGLLEPPFQTIFPTNLKSLQLQNQFALDRGYQPVPVRYADKFFPKCKNQVEIFAKRGQTIAKKLAEFQLEYSLFTERISKMFNVPIAESNIGGLVALYDTLVCDYFLGRPMPNQFTEKDFQTLKFIHRYMFSILFEDQPSRIFNAPYVNAMLGNMENAIKGKLGAKKLSVYSGHDTNVVPLMVFYNLTSAECLKSLWNNHTVIGNCAIPIPFGSSIIFELHQNDNNTTNYFVRARYNGEYFNLCGKNSTDCQFAEFAQKSRNHLMDYEKACGSQYQDESIRTMLKPKQLTIFGQNLRKIFQKENLALNLQSNELLNKVFNDLLKI